MILGKQCCRKSFSMTNKVSWQVDILVKLSDCYTIHLYILKKIPGLLLMIEFEKAFDRIAWSFLQNALVLFNLCPNIQRCIRFFFFHRDASTCISLNGQYSGRFAIQIGVRQGNPCLSDFFLICAEIVSPSLRRNTEMKGIWVKDKEVLLVQFADVTTLFLDSSEQSFPWNHLDP